jgi:hypothetical protein
MRLYGIQPGDVEAVAAHPTKGGRDERDNLRLVGFDGRGRAIIVVVANDDSNFVITTYPDD